MKPRGFTLIELITTLTVLGIVISVAIPSFSEQLKNIQTRIVMHDFLRAIESARTLAVASNNRTVLLANEQGWEQGWTLFIDKNNDGKLNGDESVHQMKTNISKIKIEPSSSVQDYISFISTGEGRKIGKYNSGSLQMGTINICPSTKGNGYALILSRGGRTRIKGLTPQECEAEN